MMKNNLYGRESRFILRCIRNGFKKYSKGTTFWAKLFYTNVKKNNHSQNTLRKWLYRKIIEGSSNLSMERIINVCNEC